MLFWLLLTKTLPYSWLEVQMPLTVPARYCFISSKREKATASSLFEIAAKTWNPNHQIQHVNLKYLPGCIDSRKFSAFPFMKTLVWWSNGSDINLKSACLLLRLLPLRNFGRLMLQNRYHSQGMTSRWRGVRSMISTYEEKKQSSVWSLLLSRE